MALIEITNLNKEFEMGPDKFLALKNINLKIEPGEFTAIIGTSGCGKTTLMNIIGLLDRPSAGTYCIGDQDMTHLSDDELSKMRNQNIGFVFQSFNLLPRASAQRNVELPLHYAMAYNKDLNENRIKEMAFHSLDRVGLSQRLNHRPNELSGGQRQRVAIARALVNSPKLLLADEPTGALDSKTTEEILTLFEKLNQEGVTIVLVTHDAKVAARCHRVLIMSDGQIIEETRRGQA